MEMTDEVMEIKPFIEPSKNFLIKGRKSSHTILNFWRWAYSGLLQNITRGVLAEYIVAWALELDRIPRQPWDAFDLKTKDGRRIEVKSSAYVQAWESKRPNPQFIIKPRKTWESNGLTKEAEFNADIYVLCYLKEKDLTKINPMNLDQWMFWIFSRAEIINLLQGKASISVAALQNKKLDAIKFEKLKVIFYKKQ